MKSRSPSDTGFCLWRTSSSWSSLGHMAKESGAYNIYEAKTKLSELVSRARRGKEVILMNRGEPVAMIVPIPRVPRHRKFGFLKGKLKLMRGWDAPIEDFKDYW